MESINVSNSSQNALFIWRNDFKNQGSGRKIRARAIIVNWAFLDETYARIDLKLTEIKNDAHWCVYFHIKAAPDLEKCLARMAVAKGIFGQKNAKTGFFILSPPEAVSENAWK